MKDSEYSVTKNTKVYFLAEKAMAPHSNTLAWRIPWKEERGRLQSMGSLGVGHNRSDLATAAVLFIRVNLGLPWWLSGILHLPNAGNTGSISDPDPERVPSAEKQLSLCATTTILCSSAQEPQPLELICPRGYAPSTREAPTVRSLCTTTREDWCSATKMQHSQKIIK